MFTLIIEFDCYRNVYCSTHVELFLYMMPTLSYLRLIYWDLGVMMPVSGQNPRMFGETKELTLNISNALLKDLLENLGVLEFLVDLANDGLGKLTLLALFNLALVTHPRVKNRLGLGSKGSALLQLVSLGLKLGGFLFNISISYH